MADTRVLNVVITGASSGIGEALAKRYAARGANLWLLARRLDRLEHLAGTAIRCDVADPKQVADAVALIDGPIDILVNNAGAGLPGAFSGSDIDEVARTVDVNLTGVMRITHALLPQMREGSTIVFVASVAGKIGMAGAAVYCSTKFGVIGFAEALRSELKRQRVHVLTVNPGPIQTEGFPHADILRSPLRGVVRSSDECATAIMRGVEHHRRTMYVPGLFRPLLAIARLVMPVTSAVMKRIPFTAGR